MAPTTLLILFVVWCVIKTYSNNVAFAVEPFDGCHCDGLRFYLRKIVDDKHCTNNVELGRITRLLIVGDAYNEFLIVELEDVLEDDVALGVHVGQYQELMRSPHIVAFPHNFFEHVMCGFTLECITFEM